MNAKFVRRDGHGKQKNGHGEVMEKSWENILKNILSLESLEQPFLATLVTKLPTHSAQPYDGN